MEGDYDILLAPIIAELDPELAVTLNRREVEVGCDISYLQRHKLNRT